LSGPLRARHTEELEEERDVAGMYAYMPASAEAARSAGKRSGSPGCGAVDAELAAQRQPDYAG
jgi:hypothetical protein